MANQLPLTVVLAGALPSGFTGTPQQLAEAIVARLRVQSTQASSVFQDGGTEPSSNVGPWLKDGTEWWVWSDDTGGYVPQVINNDSFEDGQITQSMLGADSVGTVQIIDGSVTDTELSDGSVTEAKLADGAVTEAKLGPNIVSNPHPFRASSAGTGQSITVEAAGFAGMTTLQMPTENFDPDGVYNPVTSVFTAPEAGWYISSFFLQIDNSTTNPGVSAAMQIGAGIADAATEAGLGGGVTTNVPSPVGDRWFLSSYDIIQMAAQQTAKIRIYAVDGAGGNAVDVAGAGNCYWSMHQLKVIT